MARNKSSEEHYTEGLEEKVRELKSVVRTLTKRLKKVSKGYYKYLAECEDQEQDEVQKFKHEVKDELVKVCWDCGGNYRLSVVANRRFRVCQGCGKRGQISYLDQYGNEIE